ncbi:hypothetical protein [Thermostichus vulcanus]|uniref:hypothetical protein n=1 Tax=Thermostichus vulcanus TaxID=32053 RepID=UPI001FCAB40B|nr:hypothetical protein [Thermostichus vulcanus]
MASTLPNLWTLIALPSQVSETRYFVSGEVHIEPGAGIGAGVLLRANPGCRIQIGRGVCIGMGSILHAQGGTLIIEAGATLGTGVLVIGQGTIGSNACIGSETTLLNCSILKQQVIPPGSLIGDPTYSAAANTSDSTQAEEPAQAAVSPESVPPPPPDSPVANVEKQTRRWQESAQQAEEKLRPMKLRKLNGIPGHSELDRLLGKIYPHRQALSSNDS